MNAPATTKEPPTQAAQSDVPRGKHLVFYDALCPVCRKGRRKLERMDWFKRLHFVDIHDRATAERELPDVSYADMIRRMYVKRAGGRHYGGYDALRAVAPALPLMWPAWPIMWIPGVSHLGRRMYGWVARNRFRKASCDSDVCNLHLKLLAGKVLDEEVVAEVVALHERMRGAAPKVTEQSVK